MIAAASHTRQSFGKSASVSGLRWSSSDSFRCLSAGSDRSSRAASPSSSPSSSQLSPSSLFTKRPSPHSFGPTQWGASGPSNNQGIQRRYYRCESGDSRSSAQLPPRMTIARAARLFRTSKLTSQQLCQHSHNLAFFGEESLRLNAYAKLLPLDQILEQAHKSDERIRNGTPKSLLDGIPVTIKANIAVGRFWEMPNACSAILSQGEGKNSAAKIISPGEEEYTSDNSNVYESDIAKRLLKDCGAVIVGITNMDEFGMGSLGINNGLLPDHHHEPMHQSSTQRQNQYSPTYNPLPWMQRLSTLLDSQTQQHLTIDEEDDFWLQQIRSSSPNNPHGANDENALAELVDEVHYWVCGGSNIERHGDKPASSTRQSPLLSPGGSSSGAAATTAHGSSLLSIGTDTGGSLRLPSAWTSTVGFKPSYGTWSRYGVVSYASSLDTVGFITGTTECAEIAWRCLGNRNHDNLGGASGGWNGQLCRDSTARVYHKEDNMKLGGVHNALSTDQSLSSSAKPLANIRVGIPSAFSLKELPPLIADAWSESANCLQNVGGASLVSIPESRVSFEWIKLALASYYVLACAEASSNLSRYDGVRYGMDVDLDNDAFYGNVDSVDDMAFRPLSDMKTLEQQISATRAYGFGEEIQRRILAGTSVLSSDRFHTHYEAAAVVRSKLSRSLESVFRSSLNDGTSESDKVDIMLVPTALSFPCALNSINGGEIAEEIDPTAAFANDVMTIPISLGGFPSVSVPFKGGSLDSVDDGSPDDIAVSKQIGMQIFSSRGSEDLILKAANVMQ